MKKIYALVVCLQLTIVSAQNFVIPAPAAGMNLWMPDHYITGNQSYPNGFANLKHMQTMVDNLTCQIVRVGGDDIDLNGTSIEASTLTNDYARFIQQVKSRVPNAKFII